MTDNELTARQIINLVDPSMPAEMVDVLVGPVAEQLQLVIRQAQSDERRRITAEWLCQVLPGDVIAQAAEKVAGAGY